ncbi:unnamed protein product [Pedinophyceae sp. YPF-701]|nr:unnamed protein product [Pedinophyceae sp. YPF-701]
MKCPALAARAAPAAAPRAATSQQCRPRTAVRMFGATNYAASAETISRDGLVREVRRYLRKEEGWTDYWIDGVADRITKRLLDTSLDQVRAVVGWLKNDLGMNTQDVCNMCSISCAMFGMDVEADLKPVVAYMRARGASDATVRRVLTSNPKVLEYAVTEDGKKLWKRTNNSKFLAFAEVDVTEGKDGKQQAHVSYFRENTAFESAPVSPPRPKDA